MPLTVQLRIPASIRERLSSFPQKKEERIPGVLIIPGDLIDGVGSG